MRRRCRNCARRYPRRWRSQRLWTTRRCWVCEATRTARACPPKRRPARTARPPQRQSLLAGDSPLQTFPMLQKSRMHRSRVNCGVVPLHRMLLPCRKRRTHPPYRSPQSRIIWTVPPIRLLLSPHRRPPPNRIHPDPKTTPTAPHPPMKSPRRRFRQKAPTKKPRRAKTGKKQKAKMCPAKKSPGPKRPAKMLPQNPPNPPSPPNRPNPQNPPPCACRWCRNGTIPTKNSTASP